VSQTAIPPNQEFALGNYDDGDIFEVEPRGFEPLTSAVQRRYELSGCILACPRAWLKHAEIA
jgi:hypothetical protein